ncbi:cuticular protein 47Eg-like [Homarus americanus]|uniref:Cuticular protein 47Eg-like 2 n=1 Tax=Homarus americanus TaxID=6706 RepID=A0A8J5N099_HOMAM|nr:cuticular protein 47Eg-like [Homarus americanus]KAG7170540.1 Cuticular protein 47Eg-like 2 [Homarus americanus]
MKCFVLVVLGLVALVTARPDVDLDEITQIQDIAEDNTITGSYSWKSPEGVEYFVKYIADGDGYRIVESNAVPVNGEEAADGTQGSFLSSEEKDDD